jgi:hypothetical protein
MLKKFKLLEKATKVLKHLSLSFDVIKYVMSKPKRRLSFFTIFELYQVLTLLESKIVKRQKAKFNIFDKKYS